MNLFELREYIIENSIENPAIEIEDGFFFANAKNTSFLNQNHYSCIENYSNKAEDTNIFDQIKENFFNKEEEYIAEILLQNMNSFGFLEENDFSIHKEYGIDINKVTSVRKHIQKHFEPKLLLCKNKVDFVSKNIELYFGKNSIEHKIFHYYKNNASRKKIIQDLKKLNINDCNIKEAEEKISKIPQCPITPNETEKNIFLYPEIKISFEEDNPNNFTISLNSEYYPSIFIRDEYKKYSNTKQDKCKNIKEYVGKANFIIKSIKCRKKTILLVCNEICKIQKYYLSGMSKSLAPMTMKEIAHSLNLHPSSITRSINNKYIDTPIGNISMKSLFSKGFYSKHGTLILTQTIDECLKKIISKEDKEKPLSDIEIKEQLDNLGLHCSRRHISKRRKALNILNSRNRY